VEQTAPHPRAVHVEHCMGTVFSIDIRDPGVWRPAVAEAVALLHHVDATFSTYREDSVISRLGRNELELEDTPAEVQEALALCSGIGSDSGGFFSVTAAGRLDPSGLVKGWAIERVSDLLRDHGSRNHAVNGGGDLQLAGERSPGRPWRIGINDPTRPGRLVTVVSVRDAAVATSGTAERGCHVTDPVTGRPATELASVTVFGRHLTYVDAYATAALAMGHQCRSWLECLPGHEGITVSADGTRWESGGMPAWTTRPRPRAG